VSLRKETLKKRKEERFYRIEKNRKILKNQEKKKIKRRINREKK
jgi:hypothetical protein